MGTPVRYLLLAAAIQIVWGTTPTVSTVALEYLPVEIYAAMRFGLSGLLFLTVAWSTGRPLPKRRGELLSVAGAGLLAFGVASMGTLYGLKFGGIVNLAFASSFNAPITALLALAVLREKPSPYLKAALATCVVGGLLLFKGKADLSGYSIAISSLACLWGAYLLEATGLVVSKRMREKFPVVSFLAVAHLAAAAFLLGAALVSGRDFSVLGELPGRGWAAVLFVAMVSCCLCYFLLYWLVGHMDAHKLAFFDAFHTISAAVFGYVFYREPITWEMAAGGGLLLVAVALIHSSRLNDLHRGDELLDEARGEDEVGVAPRIERKRHA